MQAQDSTAAETLAHGASIRKGSLKKGPKLLKCQVILNAAHAARPVRASSNKSKKLKGPAFKKPSTKLPQTSRQVTNATDTTENLDLWVAAPNVPDYQPDADSINAGQDFDKGFMHINIPRQQPLSSDPSQDLGRPFSDR